MTKVFVYGTLREGEHNHHLLKNSTFVGKAETRPEFLLLGRGCGYPYMVRGGAGVVVGEVYEVDEPTLDDLDRLEGHPRHYQRSLISLADGSDAQAYTVAASSYYADPIRKPVIVSGDWKNQGA